MTDTYFYDVVGTQNCTNGSYARFSFDNRGLASSAMVAHCIGFATNSSFVNNTRNVAGLVTRRYSAPGVGTITNAESDWTYDKLGRVSSQVIKKGVALDQVARQDLAYNGNDDPKSMDHWLGATNVKHFTFGYDLRHQLTSVGETGNAFTATYSYGNAGRFATAIESAAALPNSDVTARNVIYQYSATDPQQLLRLHKSTGNKDLAQYTYDDGGNQLTRYYPDTKELWEYVYDGKNQLRRATKKLNGAAQGSEEYWYDHGNQRYFTVKRNGAGTKTGAIWFIHDTEAQYDAAGAVTRAFGHLTLGTPVARIDRSSDAASSLEYQFHGLANNTLASVDQVTGSINASFAYAPFGELVEATNAGGATNGVGAHRRRMNDKFIDEVSSLAYYGYRYYDKVSMTWTQQDPMYQFGPDVSGSVPRRSMLYSMSLNNPLSYLDPDGRDGDAGGTGPFLPGPPDPLSQADNLKVAECQRTHGTAAGCGIGSRNDSAERRRHALDTTTGLGSRIKPAPAKKKQEEGFLSKVLSVVKTGAKAAKTVYKIGKVACALGSDGACEAVDAVEDAFEEFAGGLLDLIGYGAQARKADIKAVDRIIGALGLNKEQRRMLHDEITRQDLSIEEIREVAEDIKLNNPTKGTR